MSVNIRLEGDVKQLIHRLQKFSELDKKGINRAVGEALRTSTAERFKKQKDPENKSWKISIRARQAAGVTLTDSAILKHSIHSQSDDKGAAVGTNSIYAKTHQFGAKRTIRARGNNRLTFRIGDQWVSVKSVKVSIPKRPFLGLSEEDKEEIKSLLEDAISK